MTGWKLACAVNLLISCAYLKTNVERARIGEDGRALGKPHLYCLVKMMALLWTR